MDALPHTQLIARHDAALRLDALAERARWELATLSYPARPWVRPQANPDGHVHDVAIVGAGQCGLVTGFALRQCAIHNVLLLDAAPPGATGIWRRFARMATLRTPKHVTGPDLGFPSLCVRAWFEARYGEAAWGALGKIGRETWHDYLNWLAQQIDLPTEYGWRVTAVTPERDGVLALDAERADGARRRVLARHVVLGTGMDGNGAWSVPAIVRENLPRTRYAHTAEAIDFTRLCGKRVAVLGAGASAFDNAATALEHGAVRVDLLARRESLPRVNPNRWIEFHGFLSHFADLPDALRWRYMHTLFAMNQPPPQETWDRCAAHAQFHVHTGAPITSLRMSNDVVSISTPRGVFEVEFLILGTGLTIDLAQRPELAAIAPHAALWRDRFVPPPGEENATIGGFPYLGSDLSFIEREPGNAPWITRVRTCSFGSLVSSISSAGISMIRPTVERMARGIARDLFLEQANADHALLTAYDERELVSTALASDSRSTKP